MNITTEEKQKRWVIAVSGGADSMALLAKCISLDMDVVVAHMNYQKRASAQRDMQGVQAFCDAHHIPCIIRMQEKECVGNFQAFARRERYTFFHEVINTYQAYGVLIAHQLDDHLETYIMQKKRGMIPSFYGIKRSVVIHRCNILRPLLDESKAQLEAYCIKHQIPFYLDESNLSDAYTRNCIRHTYIDTMQEKDKHVLNEEIKQANIRLTTLHEQADNILENWQKDVETLQKLPYDIGYMVLRKWIFSVCHIHISQKECDTIYKLLQNEAKNWTRYINKTYDISMQYGVLSIVHRQEQEYCFTYDHIQLGQTPYFKLTNMGEVMEGITLCEADFPITIRPYRQGDRIKLRYGSKKISRFFIDHKIPKEERSLWPIVLNVHQEIIFVPKIGCNISHFSNIPNLFVLK